MIKYLNSTKSYSGIAIWLLGPSYSVYKISCIILMAPLIKFYSTIKLRSNITNEPIQIAFKSGIYDSYIQ